jgi:hypothetical protein
MNISKTVFSATLLILMGTPIASAGDHPMGFFVSSVGLGQGGNLSGLEGADAHCSKLAETAGSSGRTWHAYLSTQGKEKRGVSAATELALAPGTTLMVC